MSTEFEPLGLHPEILKGIQDLGYTRPTPIQKEAIPHIMTGRDTIACAQTGTGKTAAFVLPVLHRLMDGTQRGHGVKALFLAPTRELALQSTQQLQDLSRYVPLRGTSVFGGVSMYPQTKALKEGVDIISATPGRLLDHVYQGNIDFGALEVFVLDEADRMMDMGFLPDVEKIISMLPPKRQNIIVSATMPAEVLKIVKRIAPDPITVQVGVRQSTAAGIRHAIYPVSREQKTELLLRILQDTAEKSSIIVFTRTKQMASKLTHTLERAGVPVGVIHGDRTQAERLRALDAFKAGNIEVLVATDVAARGIDVKDISHVINYDIPQTPEDYIHRAGRTARAESTGDAFSLVAPDEEEMVKEIEQVINKSLPRVTLPNFHYRKGGSAPSHGGGHAGHRGGRPQHGGGGGRPQSRPGGGHRGPRHGGGHQRPRPA